MSALTPEDEAELGQIQLLRIQYTSGVHDRFEAGWALALLDVRERVIREVRTLIDESPNYTLSTTDPENKPDGYNCCGCTTYQRIVNAIESIINDVAESG